MKILLATDGLPAAEAAEQLLVRAARRDLDVVVVAAADGKNERPADVQEVVTRSVRRLEEAGFRPTGEALEGRAKEVLHRYVGDAGADIVVLGSGNKSWLGRMLFGSISTQMLHSARSVLIVNEPPATHEDGMRVLVAMDGSAEAAAPDRAIAFLDPERCSVRLFSVVALRVPSFEGAPVTGYAAPGSEEKVGVEITERRRRAVEDRAALFGAAGFDVETRVTLGAPVKRILEEARDIDASLVVVGGKPRGRLERVLVGSVSDQVTRYTRAALILRPNGDGSRA